MFYTVFITIIYLSIEMNQIKQTQNKSSSSTTVNHSSAQSQLRKPQVIRISNEIIKSFVNMAK